MTLRKVDSCRRLAESPFMQAAVRVHRDRLLGSPQFDASVRSRRFFEFVVGETLDGRGEQLSQTAIAMAVFNRDVEFDAVLDPIVRVQAGRLRRSLERYYLLTGDTYPVQIELPKGSYTPAFVYSAGGAAVNANRSARDTAEWPTVFLQRFETGQGVDPQALACLEDEIAMELARYGNIGVVRERDNDRIEERHITSSRFELRGSLRQLGDHIEVRTRLLDRKTGLQMWGDEYHTGAQAGLWTSDVDDVGRVIAGRVGADDGVILRKIISEHGGAIPDAGVVNAVLRSHQFFYAPRSTDLVPTIRALQNHAASEPENPALWIQLARLRLANHAFELSDLRTPVEESIREASCAVRLDPTSPRARCILAAALLVKGELGTAQEEVDHSLRLNFGSLAYREVSGWLTALCGDWQRGMAIMRTAAERNPNCLPYLKHGLWADYLLRGEYEKAYGAALEFWDVSPFWRDLMMSASLGHLGRLCEARICITELLEANPGFRTRGPRLIGNLIKSPPLLEKIFDGLARSGLKLG